EPDDPKVIEKGSIRKEKIVETFEQFPWIDHLRQMAGMKEDATNQGVTFSIVGTESDHEFYIFYKRTATIRTLGLFKKQVDNHISDITGQTKEDAINFLQAFLNNDTAYLEEKIKNG